MLKYIHKATVAFIALSMAMVSCKKSFLEVVPKGQLVAKNYEDYNLLMNSSTFYLYGTIGIWQPAMLMGDDVSAEENYFNQSSSPEANLLFQWNPDIFVPSTASYSNSDRPLFLQTIFGNIYTLNKIINEVNGSDGGTLQQKKEVAAEAKVTRAFTNFQLINYFAKPYNASTAGSDPGFPMITTADITATDFKRGTLQQMYDFIISDITAALPDLNTAPKIRTRWSRAAAEGFLGKVYLFMGKNTDALSMLNAAFTDLGKMGAIPKLYDYNQAFAANGAFQPIDPIYGPNTPYNNLTDLTESVVFVASYSGNYDGNNFGNDFLTIDPKTLSLFSASDLRLNLFTNLQQDQTTIEGGRVRRYTVPYSSYARIGLEMPDLYLLRAEAKARTNDLTGAVTDVETLRKNRMPAADATVPSSVSGNQNALVKFIINERQREFAGLGYRWWDMRRLSVDPVFTGTAAATHTLFLTGGGSTQFTLKPERLTLRIPNFYLKGHPDMVNNP
ncbi:RagB/SusD family nutrient uptake outer membrane protein [Mucilaginibacter sp. RS28]|uniref:RagB/SusD family nutrient uptake outer membrane protein n=1 Tax=Mucilaginibacter straminoryzae TaxID=2932774 RepID=A0A9X1X537_9SPHI|nr:RagB/SusD family nutrient uptake outer membrane protein [Mucilaginibacter straminoryzae]MCJ8208834.1 RagB/SusD family nutrient uptake outer membrane protein [Mucilaginibacter straminoryzae]